MAYQRSPRDDNTNADNIAKPPDAPRAPSVTVPQVSGVRGGAPRLDRGTPRPPDTPKLRPTITSMPINPETSTVTPTTMPLPDAQKYLSDLSASIKQVLDTRLAKAPPTTTNGSRFWSAYKDYPEQMALLMARRVWTNQIVSTGPVAQWMNYLNRG